MNDKSKIAENFLKTLEDQTYTLDLINERIDKKVLYVMHRYAELIDKSTGRIDLTNKEVIASAMIMGFLLKSHLDRYDLEKSLHNLNLE